MNVLYNNYYRKLAFVIFLIICCFVAAKSYACTLIFNSDTTFISSVDPKLSTDYHYDDFLYELTYTGKSDIKIYMKNGLFKKLVASRKNNKSCVLDYNSRKISCIESDKLFVGLGHYIKFSKRSKFDRVFFIQENNDVTKFTLSFTKVPYSDELKARFYNAYCPE